MVLPSKIIPAWASLRVTVASLAATAFSKVLEPAVVGKVLEISIKHYLDRKLLQVLT